MKRKAKHHEYTFEIKVWTTIRLTAPNKVTAVSAAEIVVEGLELSRLMLERINEQMDLDFGYGVVNVIEVAVSPDESHFYPTEIDGEEQ